MNVQFEEQGVIKTFNLACRKVNESHTAVNKKRWIRQIFEQYELQDHQIIVFAADSAANIQKAAALFLRDLKGSNFFVCDLTDDEDEDDDEAEEEDEIVPSLEELLKESMKVLTRTTSRFRIC